MDSRRGPVAGSTEPGNETSDSIKGQGITWIAQRLLVSYEGVFFSELVEIQLATLYN
jgi:hypothetical protein